MRILVCGGRDFTNKKWLFHILDSLDKKYSGDVIIIEGGQRGADALAGSWAETRVRAHFRIPADWEGLGRAAGPIRNRRMLEEGRPDMVVAFPGGDGTANMVKLANQAGIGVVEMLHAP